MASLPGTKYRLEAAFTPTPVSRSRVTTTWDDGRRLQITFEVAYHVHTRHMVRPGLTSEGSAVTAMPDSSARDLGILAGTGINVERQVTVGDGSSWTDWGQGAAIV
jgi:hypothetical protein